jgi:hypothetical protein
VTPYKLLLVPEDQIAAPAGSADGDCHMAAPPDGKAYIVTMDTGWRRLVGPFEIIADIPEDGSITMSRGLYETVKVVDP